MNARNDEARGGGEARSNAGAALEYTRGTRGGEAAREAAGYAEVGAISGLGLLAIGAVALVIYAAVRVKRDIEAIGKGFGGTIAEVGEDVEKAVDKTEDAFGLLKEPAETWYQLLGAAAYNGGGGYGVRDLSNEAHRSLVENAQRLGRAYGGVNAYLAATGGQEAAIMTYAAARADGSRGVEPNAYFTRQNLPRLSFAKAMVDQDGGSDITKLQTFLFTKWDKVPEYARSGRFDLIQDLITKDKLALAKADTDEAIILRNRIWGMSQYRPTDDIQALDPWELWFQAQLADRTADEQAAYRGLWDRNLDRVAANEQGAIEYPPLSQAETVRLQARLNGADDEEKQAILLQYQAARSSAYIEALRFAYVKRYTLDSELSQRGY